MKEGGEAGPKGVSCPAVDGQLQLHRVVADERLETYFEVLGTQDITSCPHELVRAFFVPDPPEGCEGCERVNLWELGSAPYLNHVPELLADLQVSDPPPEGGGGYVEHIGGQQV